jgi:hypothetical protein
MIALGAVATLSCAAVSSLGVGCSSNLVQSASDGGARDAQADAKSDAAPGKRVDARGRSE